LNQEALLSKSVFDVFDESFPKLRELYQSVRTAGSNWEFELYRPQNGNWYSVKTHRQDDLLLLIFVDITPYKSHSEDLETFFDVSLDMFSIADMEGHFLKLNQEWRNVLGYTQKELEMTNFMDLIHPDDIESTKQALVDLTKQQAVSNFINRYRASNGDYHFIEWKAVPIGGLVYSSSRDVTLQLMQAEQIENQERFRQIIGNIGGVFWLMSADMSELLFISPHYTELFGESYNYSETPFEALIRLVHPDDREMVIQKFQEYFESGNDFREFRIIKSTGETVWLSSSIFQVLDNKNQLIRHAGLIQDITKRKEVELSEIEKANRLKAIVGAMPDVLVTYNTEGEFLEISASESKFRIFPEPEVKGKRVSDFFPPETTKLFLDAIRECIATQSLQSRTFQYTGEAKPRYFENRFMPIDTERVLSVVRDITESVEKDHKLLYQLKLQQLLIKTSQSYISVQSDNLNDAINNSLSDLGQFIGADRFFVFEYLKDKHLFNNTHEWCAEGVEPLIQDLQGVDASFFQEWVKSNKDGEIKIIQDVYQLEEGDPMRQLLESQGVVSLISVPLFDDGEYTGFIGLDFEKQTTIEDVEIDLLNVFAGKLVSVRQRLRSSAELEIALQNAEESDRIKSAFLATISHELRTPLNHILGFSDLIREQSDNEHIKDFAVEINQSGKDLLRLIEEMFTLALAENSALVVRNSPVKGVNLYISCKETITEILHRSGKEEKIKLNFNADPALMTVNFLVDKQKVQQIISSLVNNAVKFTHSGYIEFGMSRTKQSLQFYVKDTGIGISQDNFRIIFDMFRQLDDRLSRSFGGLGIGLSISKKLADVLNGTISLESEAGKGSTFYLTVPVQFV
jgi:PAS domain S-box-containing protein